MLQDMSVPALQDVNVPAPGYEYSSSKIYMFQDMSVPALQDKNVPAPRYVPALQDMNGRVADFEPGSTPKLCSFCRDLHPGIFLVHHQQA